jgi:hypothetical protein
MNVAASAAISKVTAATTPLRMRVSLLLLLLLLLHQSSISLPRRIMEQKICSLPKASAHLWS